MKNQGMKEFEAEMRKVARGEIVAPADTAEPSVESTEALMAWVKPRIDEGLAALGRSEFVALEDHKAPNAALLDSLNN